MLPEDRRERADRVAGKNDDFQLRRMNRKQLVEIIYALQKKNKEISEERDNLRKQLEKKGIAISNAGSIAEASLSLSGIFENAQKAADEYLTSVKALSAKAANATASTNLASPTGSANIASAANLAASVDAANSAVSTYPSNSGSSVDSANAFASRNSSDSVSGSLANDAIGLNAARIVEEAHRKAKAIEEEANEKAKALIAAADAHSQANVDEAKTEAASIIEGAYAEARSIVDAAALELSATGEIPPLPLDDPSLGEPFVTPIAESFAKPFVEPLADDLPELLPVHLSDQSLGHLSDQLQDSRLAHDPAYSEYAGSTYEPQSNPVIPVVEIELEDDPEDDLEDEYYEIPFDGEGTESDYDPMLEGFSVEEYNPADANSSSNVYGLAETAAVSTGSTDGIAPPAEGDIVSYEPPPSGLPVIAGDEFLSPGVSNNAYTDMPPQEDSLDIPILPGQIAMHASHGGSHSAFSAQEASFGGLQPSQIEGFHTPNEDLLDIPDEILRIAQQER